MTKDNGGPAFPATQYHVDGSVWCQSGGMSLRDYFAGQALAGMATDEVELDVPNGQTPEQMRAEYWRFVAEAAYVAADAMLAARKAAP